MAGLQAAQVLTFSFDKVKKAVTRALRYSDSSVAELAPDIASEILGEVHACVASETDARSAPPLCAVASVALRGRGTHDQVRRWANTLTDQVVEQIADTPRVSTSHLVSASLHAIAEFSSIGWLRYRFVRAAMPSPDQLALEIVAYQHRHRGELPLLDREDELDPPNVA